MAKVSILPIANLQNESSAVGTINANFEAIQEAIEKTLSRDGTSPNALDATLDANGQRVINLPTPVDYTDAARHGDLQQYVDAAENAQEAAENAQAAAELAQSNAETAEENAETAEINAEAALASFLDIWHGVHSSDPEGSFSDGDIYFNSTTSALMVYSGSAWVQGYVVPDDFVPDAPDDGAMYARQSEDWTSFSLADFVESTDITDIVVLTQTEYDLLTPDANTLYFIEEEE